MTFLPINVTAAERKRVPPIGSTEARLAIVGEAPGADEERLLRPFVGPAGYCLDQCMQAAGLIRSEIYFTNVVKVRPPANDISPYFNGKIFTAKASEWLEELKDELNRCQANVIIPVGNTALCALTGLTSIMKYRGYVFESVGLAEPRKVIPTIHPAAALRGQYLYRYFISHDLRKAKKESETRELVRPDRYIKTQWTWGELYGFLHALRTAKILSVDIEVINFEVSCIGFSTRSDNGYSIPIYNTWSLEQETIIWRLLAEVLEDPAIVKVMQNGIFDTQFLASRCGIIVRGEIQDTMIAHSLMYPEFPKGLAFLVSVYGGTQAYYKDMASFKSIKKED